MSIRLHSGSQHVCQPSAVAPLGPAFPESSLSARFQEQVGRHGDCLAVVGGEHRLTYAELAAWSNGVGHRLVRSGIRPGDRVGLLLDQGAEAVAAVLGTLTAGGAYVPLDPATPETAGRNVTAAEVAGIVTVPEYGDTARAIAPNLPIIIVTPEMSALRPPQVCGAPDDIAYVYFTSGSTGEPKGVVDSHRNVLHNVLRYTNTLSISPLDRHTLIQSPTFSGTVSTLFSTLLNGAAVYPFPLGLRSPAELAELIRVEELTIYHSVPAIFRALVRTGGTFPTVRLVRLEGDGATSRDVELHRAAFSGSSVLVNGLGATETGLIRQFFVQTGLAIEAGPLPVGYAVPDVEVRVILEGGGIAALGEVGEVVVLSAYLAHGYDGRPELNADRFSEDPDGLRTYRTGDLGSLRPDGCLEIHGRADGALRVRGVRVDRTRVEQALFALSDVADAAVDARASLSGATRLVAWIVTVADAEPSPSAIRRRLAALLPTSHVPSAIVRVAAFPVTTHGKIDRRALPDPPDRLAAGRIASNPLEERLLRVWESALEVGGIGTDESFFDLGGDSLAAAEIVGAAELEAGRQLDASILLEAPTVERLAAVIGSTSLDRPTLVRLFGEGEVNPVFLAHDATGDVWIYRGLASRLGQAPVWGLRQNEPLDDTWTFERHAARLCDAIRSEQPAGPYRLGGHCFGAVLAFEMARQLAADGEEIELLALLGISPWDFPRLTPAAWRRYAGIEPAGRRLLRHAQHARGLGLRRGVAHLLTRARSVPSYVAARRGAQPLTLRTDAWRQANADAVSKYVPHRFGGAAVLVLARETTVRYTTDPAADWAGVADHVEVRVVDGTDADLLIPPSVDDTARFILTRTE